ncbi:unnamed protein product [Lathyrus oleraceus]
MTLSTYLFLLITISLMLISHAISPTPSPNPKLYEAVCDVAGVADQRCMKLLESNPKITSAKDYLTLSWQ